MNVRRIAVVAALLVVSILCGCAGYFHYHPIKSVEQEKPGDMGAKLFESKSVPVSPAISTAPVAEETIIK